MAGKTENFTMESVDILSAVEDLVGVGIKQKHAEQLIRQMQRFRDADISKLSTKQDLQILQLELTKKIDDDHAILQKNIDQLDAKIDKVELSLEKKIETAINGQTKWIIGTVIAATGLLIAIKFFG